MSHEPMDGVAPAAASRPRGTGAAFVCGWAMAVLAMLAMPAFAAVAAKDGAAPANPRLASLRVDIWPEFDRPAALIILQGELPPDTPLPAMVSLRIPAASGRPSAVAFTNAAEGRLLNLQHEVETTGDYSTVRFASPERFFHLEYYEALATEPSVRIYTYDWPGDFAVNRLIASVQEPAAASDISVHPDLGPGATGPHGMVYRTADLGAYEAGKPLQVVVRYTKADSRTSAEIFKLNAPAAKPAVPAPSAWIAIAAAAAVALAAALAALWWWRRRRNAASAARPATARFCPRCGAAPRLGDHYCSSCGAAIGDK